MEVVLDALNPCTFATALGNLASSGYTTFVLPANALFQLVEEQTATEEFRSQTTVK